MNIFDQGNVGLYAQALQARTQQIETVSSNIANEHTPGYKAKSLSFESMINQQSKLSATHEKHMPAGNVSTSLSINEGNSLDQNTVNGLQERMNFVEITTQYQLVQEFYASHMSGIKTAFKGRSE